MNKNDKINWKRDADGNFVKSLRGYDATIEIEASGQATLTIVGDDAPAPETYNTRGIAKAAFVKFLRDK